MDTLRDMRDVRIRLIFFLVLCHSLNVTLSDSSARYRYVLGPVHGSLTHGLGS